jgi:hypothetical protein
VCVFFMRLIPVPLPVIPALPLKCKTPWEVLRVLYELPRIPTAHIFREYLLFAESLRLTLSRSENYAVGFSNSLACG